jgi:hypothetical protein
MFSTRLAAAFIVLVFVCFAVIQLNDADPLRWILIYGATAILAVLKMFFRMGSAWHLALAAIASIWALSLLPTIFEYAEFKGTELEREFLGLVLVTVSMWILKKLPSAVGK